MEKQGFANRRVLTDEQIEVNPEDDLKPSGEEMTC